MIEQDRQDSPPLAGDILGTQLFNYFVASLGDAPAERGNLPKGCAKGIPVGPVALIQTTFPYIPHTLKRNF